MQGKKWNPCGEPQSLFWEWMFSDLYVSADCRLQYGLYLHVGSGWRPHWLDRSVSPFLLLPKLLRKPLSYWRLCGVNSLGELNVWLNSLYEGFMQLTRFFFVLVYTLKPWIIRGRQVQNTYGNKYYIKELVKRLVWKATKQFSMGGLSSQLLGVICCHLTGRSMVIPTQWSMWQGSHKDVHPFTFLIFFGRNMRSKHPWLYTVTLTSMIQKWKLFKASNIFQST